jgi:FOG: EAL domain
MKTNSVKLLDRMVIQRSLEELARLDEERINEVGVLITLSESSINDTALPAWLAGLIEQKKIPQLGKALIFEVSERDFLNNTHQAKLQLGRLRKTLGVNFALSGIEDPGTLNQCMKEKNSITSYSPRNMRKRGRCL